VHAAALNACDWHMLRGDPYVARLMGEVGLTKPKFKHRVDGVDGAGVVEAVGANVRGLQPGEEVLGWFQGSCAEYAGAAVDRVVPKPARLTFEQAAAVTMAGRDRPARDPGHRTGAGRAPGADRRDRRRRRQLRRPDRGGAGRRGHRYASTRNVELVRSIGAAHVIDYPKDDFTDGRTQYDVIHDNVGNQPLRRLQRALTPRARLRLAARLQAIAHPLRAARRHPPRPTPVGLCADLLLPPAVVVKRVLMACGPQLALSRCEGVVAHRLDELPAGPRMSRILPPTADVP
jgi:hypothetical protein